jgi:allophanate hydrolase
MAPRPKAARTSLSAMRGDAIYCAAMGDGENLLIGGLLSAYRSGRFTVRERIGRLLDRIDAAPERHAWIARLERGRVMDYVAALERPDAVRLPLYGIPFAIKDNIDLAGVPTTAGCPQYAYTPARSAAVVERLIGAGAIPLGKTNLDQFATGLVGTRSPYGVCRNSIDGAYISGGSSSGSAVAVASGLASFALGTDTAGSGRVPAAFNNLIGLKPSIGRISAHGVVPACRSLDCVSIFALSAEDAAVVLDCAQGFDAADSYSRPLPDLGLGPPRFGVPRRGQLQFFGDHAYARLFDEAARRLEGLGWSGVEIDFAPFLEAARLLYEGPWVAERAAAVGEFIDAHPDAVQPVTRQIISAGNQPSAVDAYRGQYRLMELKRASQAAWAEVSLILTPTAPTIYTIAAVEADPIRLNANLGLYTNFLNFFDLAAVAVPAGFRADGLPFGITLVGPHSTERALLALAGRMHRSLGAKLGALDVALPPPEDPRPALAPGFQPIAVCGAHMTGLPLNGQLTGRGGYLLRAARTAPHYRLFALNGGPPSRPGLLRVARGGAAIDLEVWALPCAEFGSFLAGIPAPLGLGHVELDDGARVPGFLCESYATADASDITALGGWRAHLAAART